MDVYNKRVVFISYFNCKIYKKEYSDERVSGYYLLNNSYPTRYHINYCANKVPDRKIYTITDLDAWLHSDMTMGVCDIPSKYRVSRKAQYPIFK